MNLVGEIVVDDGGGEVDDGGCCDDGLCKCFGVY